MVLSLFSKENIVPNITQEAIEQFTIASLVSCGMGVAIVPETMINVKYPNLHHVELSGTDNKTGIGAVTKGETSILISNFLKCYR